MVASAGGTPSPAARGGFQDERRDPGGTERCCRDRRRRQPQLPPLSLRPGTAGAAGEHGAGAASAARRKELSPPKWRREAVCGGGGRGGVDPLRGRARLGAFVPPCSAPRSYPFPSFPSCRAAPTAPRLSPPGLEG